MTSGGNNFNFRYTNLLNLLISNSHIT